MHRIVSSFGVIRLMVALSLLLVIVGCGFGSTSDPTPSATSPPEPTVGELADRIAAAWANVSTYRTISYNDVAQGTPPAISPEGLVQDGTVTEVVLPDRSHLYSTTHGNLNWEYVVIGEDVYGRGSTTEPLTRGEGEWRIVDPSSLDPESADSMLVNGSMGPARPLYSGLSADERSRTAKPLGTIDVNGQECQAYQIVDTTPTGERIDITLALNSSDLPCSIQTKVGGINYVSTLEFNIPLTIEPPIINFKPFR